MPAWFPSSEALEAFDFGKLNAQIADRFVSALGEQVQEEIAAGALDLRSRFEELRGIFSRSNAVSPHGATKRRTRWIGELRRLLAQVCIATLKPDLIILDEFQRFKHLLDEDSDAGDLARGLFDSEAGDGARVLLLSATPYRGLSLYHEADDDHYGDFLALLRFLENSDAAGCKEILAEYRAALPAVMTPDGLDRLRGGKNGAPATPVPGDGADGTSRLVKSAGRHASRCAAGRRLASCRRCARVSRCAERRRRGGAGGRRRILEVGALLVQLHG